MKGADKIMQIILEDVIKRKMGGKLKSIVVRRVDTSKPSVALE